MNKETVIQFLNGVFKNVLGSAFEDDDYFEAEIKLGMVSQITQYVHVYPNTKTGSYARVENGFRIDDMYDDDGIHYYVKIVVTYTNYRTEMPVTNEVEAHLIIFEFDDHVTVAITSMQEDKCFHSEENIIGKPYDEYLKLKLQYS